MSAISAGWLYVGWGAPLFETNYGLMQHSPSEIKERLLKALDKEYHVVDMAAVLEIVSILERTPITKEALETTRLGRDINELRRKTKNESLAKRAKELVKRWRDLILRQSEAETSQQNGGRSVRRGPISPATSVANSDKSSPGLPDAVPRTHASNKRLRKEGGGGSPEGKKSRVVSPEIVNGGSPDCEIVSVTKRDIVKEKISSIARVAKVKTTKELVDGLRGVSGVVGDLARNKTEHIARFLRSEPTQAPEEVEEEEEVEVEIIDPTPPPCTRTPPEDILARLPPVDLESIDWSEEPPPSPKPPPSPRQVDRLLEEQVDSLNGNLQEDLEFREWHQLLTRTYPNGDVIHILPYVVID